MIALQALPSVPCHGHVCSQILPTVLNYMQYQSLATVVPRHMLAAILHDQHDTVYKI